MKKNSLKVLSLFAGAGGMDLGFKNSGYEIMWANDIDPDSVKTYKKNIGSHIVLGDIEKIRTDKIPNGADVIIGGFPCQGFSIANKGRHVDDSRNKLYKQMLRIIRVKRPKYFVAEKFLTKNSLDFYLDYYNQKLNTFFFKKTSDTFL